MTASIGGKEAIDAMASGFSDSSALLRHEIAYVMGQMQDPLAVEALSRSLAAGDEHPMVRHEAAEALGAIANDDTLPLMKQYACDKERVVRESCEVALVRALLLALSRSATVSRSRLMVHWSPF